MDNLVRHIEYLILRHDCVIVPGIGAFINVYEKPEFNVESGKILPMRREVRFNSALRTDDGMLANSFARKLGVSYREGSEMLSRSVALLSSLLISDGEVALGRLGILHRECEGNIIFLPFQNADTLNAELGFLPASILTRATSATRSDAHNIPESDDTAAEETPDDHQQPAGYAKKLNFEKNYYIPVNKIFAKACACLIVVFMICFLSVNNVSDSRIREDQASVLPIEKIIDTAVRSSAKTETSALADPTQREITASPIDSNVTEDVATPPSCYLIVATFKNRSEAETFIAGNSGKGYTLEIAPGKTLCRVSAMSSSERGSLFAELNSESFRAAFPGGGWVWEK